MLVSIDLYEVKVLWGTGFKKKPKIGAFVMQNNFYLEIRSIFFLIIHYAALMTRQFDMMSTHSGIYKFHVQNKQTKPLRYLNPKLAPPKKRFFLFMVGLNLWSVISHWLVYSVTITGAAPSPGASRNGRRWKPDEERTETGSFVFHISEPSSGIEPVFPNDRQTDILWYLIADNLIIWAVAS